jgi:diguanylate cyclase (GGDEF)-like protein/PAS domain S-box-containing protein
VNEFQRHNTPAAIDLLIVGNGLILVPDEWRALKRGVILSAMLTPLPTPDNSMPRLSATLRDRFVLLVVMAGGIALSLLAGNSLQKAEALKTQEQENAALQAAVSVLNLEFARTTQAVRNAGLMIETNPQLTREQFNRYMQKMVENQLSVNLMEWQPIVPAAQLAQFEADAQASGSPDFRVVQPDASGTGWEPVHGRDEYVPVLFCWPQSYRTEGLDMSFSPQRMASKLQSRTVGQPVASGAFEFMKEGVVKSGSMAVAISTTVFGTDQTAKGYVAAVADLPTLFRQAALVADASELDFLVFATESSKDAALFSAYGNGSDLPQSSTTLRLATAGDPSATVDFALQTWKVVLHPRPAFYAKTQEKGSRLALLGGLGLTLLFVFFLYQRQKSRQKIGRAESAASIANLALDVERQRLQEAQRIARVGSWQMDLSGTQTWSEEMYRMLGLTPGQTAPLYEQASTLFTPESWERLVAALARTMDSGALYELELEMIKADGNHGWMLARGEAVRDAQGAIVGARGTATEITELKHAETSFYRITTMMARTENMARLASFEWEIDTNTVTWSPEMFRIFGRDPALGIPNLEGQAELYTPESTQTLFAAVNKALSDGTPYELELMTVQPDGALRPCIVKGFPERDGDGRVVRISGLVQDITERKQAEQYERFRSHTLERLAANETLATLLETIVLGVEQLHPSMLCSILLLDGAGRHLGKGVAPSLPDFYNAALDGVEIGIGVGSCGTAAFTGERVIVTDIASHPYWAPYKELAASAGLSACWSQPIRGASGQVLGTFAIYHRAPHTPSQADIDLIEQTANLTSIAIERKLAQEKLQLAAGVFTHALEGIMITGPDATIIDVNEAFTRITGYSRSEAIGRNSRILQSGRQDKAFYQAMWAALSEQGHWSGEVWNKRKDGEVYAELLTISAVRDGQGNTQQHVALFSDITERKEYESKLEHIAHFDALTHLPNRVLLADRLQHAMAQEQRRGQQLAVAYLDLDGFKDINDRYGHETGDQVLITLSRRMKETLRDGDTLARLGGDEFVAVLIDLEDASNSLPLINRLLAAAAQPVQVGELSLQVSASLGVTFYPQIRDIDADQLLRQADQAMYQAKVAGKNRYSVFDAAQDSTIRVHHESLERIRLALENREFVLHYQPKVNMHSGQVFGAEALIRWQHPEKGLLAPAAFLPVIEDHALAVDVGEWVIDAALSQIEVWHSAGLEMPVSVNVGARQLQQVNFVARLQAILAQHPHVSPTQLKLEVLETSALADMEQVSQVIEECRKMGVKFALDDFGTGYSSLTYLKSLRVALLKIDQSFVRDMLEDPDDLAILQGVIGLAAAFKREVIAEGVETVAHGTALLRLGCTLAQGYGIARPMPANELPAWTATWQPDAAWGAVPISGDLSVPSDKQTQEALANSARQSTA